jgi:transcriptional regulator with XRE-family HTH domain
VGTGQDGRFLPAAKSPAALAPVLDTVTAPAEGAAMTDQVVPGPGQRERRSRPLLRTMLGDALRRARQAQGRTLADVSAAARVSVPYLSELERGRKEASSEVLAAICDGLRVDLADLLAEVGRDLALSRARPVQVLRLGLVPLTAPGSASTTPGPAGPPAGHRPGDVTALLAA